MYCKILHYNDTNIYVFHSSLTFMQLKNKLELNMSKSFEFKMNEILAS